MACCITLTVLSLRESSREMRQSISRIMYRYCIDQMRRPCMKNGKRPSSVQSVLSSHQGLIPQAVTTRTVKTTAQPDQTRPNKAIVCRLSKAQGSCMLLKMSTLPRICVSCHGRRLGATSTASENVQKCNACQMLCIDAIPLAHSFKPLTQTCASDIILWPGCPPRVPPGLH